MFERIIGYDNVKKELSVVIDMVVNREKYERLGANLVNGILLHGEPGTGKTTFASEFITACGIDAFTVRKDRPADEFLSHIKKTFEEAKKAAPSIVFLDDMDKFTDDAHPYNSEEFSTVQACIDEVKGSGVLILATANDIEDFPDSLLRAGRFDIIISVDNPNLNDAQRIVKHYLNERGFGENLDCEEIARLLDGGSCAQLESVINEAVIIAAYDGREEINNDDVLQAAMRVIYDSPSNAASTGNRYSLEIAYHEAGHAIVSEILEPGSVNLISIKRGNSSGGFTSYQQSDDYFTSVDCMENRIIALLAGKAANDVVFGKVDVGCSRDLDRAYRIATRFVDDYCAYGFTSWEGITHGSSTELKNRKETLVSYEIQKYYLKAKRVLIENREFLDLIANDLMNKGVVTYRRIQEIKAELSAM